MTPTMTAPPFKALLLAACLLAAWLFTSCPAWAIDGRHASAGYERLTCHSRRLMAAHQGLNSLFEAARGHARHPRDIVQSQRAWIAAIPSRCGTERCLAKAYAARMRQLAASYAGWCASRTPELQHDWQGGARALFEELSLGAGTYRSWLHQRPDSWGSWRADGCVLVLHAQPDGLDVHWVLLDVGPRRLRVFDLDDQDVTVYRRGSR